MVLCNRGENKNIWNHHLKNLKFPLTLPTFNIAPAKMMVGRLLYIFRGYVKLPGGSPLPLGSLSFARLSPEMVWWFRMVCFGGALVMAVASGGMYICKNIPSGTLTSPWNITMFNRKYMFKGCIFQQAMLDMLVYQSDYRGWCLINDLFMAFTQGVILTTCYLVRYNPPRYPPWD